MATIASVKIRLAKIRLAGVNTPFKKNEINRELDKDTGGDPFEQDLFDLISESATKNNPGNAKSINKQISKGFKKKPNKDGTLSFTIKDWK
jgi:hypothetical protein